MFSFPKDTTSALIESTELVTKLQAELEAARAEIERLQGINSKLCDKSNRCIVHTARLEQQLAAEQAKNVGLRGNLENIGNKARIRDAFWVELTVAEAIATPSDTSALEAMIAKAGEKMRERMIASGFSQPHEEYFGDTIQLTIRALPAVTLEDLK